jgi:hypothetical protein
MREVALSAERQMARVVLDLLTFSKEIYERQVKHTKEAGL